jgi:hypothetical protein
MSTAETIFEKTKALPENQQIDTPNFVDFLILQDFARTEASEWASFSDSQLSRQSSDEDAIYDQV